jgi:solute carrier family 6 GABA transporter-like protein 6/8/11/12/13
VFRGINKNLAGIGVISVYSSYIFSFYYNVIVAWALVYVIAGCMSPLPWSMNKTDGKWPCNLEADGTEKKVLKISRAE